MIIRREWAMPNKHTFLIKPIKDLIEKYVGNGKNWVDPFAGENSPAEITNDLNSNKPTVYHLDALEFLKTQKDESFIGVIYDPPYSITQARQIYDSFGCDKFNVSSMNYWSECKNQIARIVCCGGVVICCGWNSNGIGINRFFITNEILLVAHGGSKNDTIITVERKVQTQGKLF